MKTLERLIRYCEVDTTSDPECTNTPSTLKQFDLARMLEKELKDLGVQDVYLSDNCYVYACIKGNPDKPKIAFIAHMDTAPDYNGTGVKPVVIEHYNGESITLKDGKVIDSSKFPHLLAQKDKTLVVADGTTLLGADDKAGVAAIMAAAEYVMNHEFDHGDMYIVFTPDEEVGGGTKCFEYDKCPADFGFTMDGGAVDIYEEETFNAASAVAKFTGVNIHPGSAKDRMRNASLVAMEFNSMLPVNMRPEFTEGRDGFFHMMHMEGNIEKAQLGYIIRNHSAEIFENQIKLLKDVETFINAKYGDCCEVTVKYSYKNMKEVMKDYPYVKELAFKAMSAVGLTPKEDVIRGGTDGANLSFNGLPCPNLGAGGGNFHGPLEYCVAEEMETASELIIKILELA